MISFFAAHSKSVRGIAVDSANLKVVSGSLDGLIKVGNCCILVVIIDKEIKLVLILNRMS